MLIGFLLVAAFVILVIYLFKCISKERQSNRPVLDIYEEDRQTDTFVAVDTETATVQKDICQIAYVYVKNGEFVSRDTFLIRPRNNKYDRHNIKIHHITPDMTAGSPSLEEVWPEIEAKIIEAGAFVAHNAGFDIDSIQRSLDKGTSVFDVVNVIDTCKITDYSSLYSCCRYFDIDLPKHHDALCDANACAKLLLKLKDFPPYGYIPKVDEPSDEYIPEIKAKSRAAEKKSVEILYSDTIFKNKTCVCSGVFEDWPIREKLEDFLMSCGAKVTHSISSRTDYFIVGEDPGPSKIQKAIDISSNGGKIQFISQKKLAEIVVEIRK